MLKKIFDQDNPVMRFLSFLADIIILNLLFVLSCIPIITIGAALSGLYYVTLKMIRGREGGIVKTYVEGFKGNFRQATAAWAIMAAIGGVLYLDYWAVGLLGGQLPAFFRYGLYVFAMLFAFVFSYLFPLLATFDNTVARSLKNAFLMSISNFPYTVAVVAIWVSPYFILTKFTMLTAVITPFAILTGFGLVAYFCSWFFWKVFAKFMTEEEREIWEDAT